MARFLIYTIPAAGHMSLVLPIARKLLMLLNMLIQNGDAFDYMDADFWSWRKEAGFKRCEVLHLAGSCNAAIAYK